MKTLSRHVSDTLSRDCQGFTDLRSAAARRPTEAQPPAEDIVPDSDDERLAKAELHDEEGSDVDSPLSELDDDAVVSEKATLAEVDEGDEAANVGFDAGSDQDAKSAPEDSEPGASNDEDENFFMSDGELEKAKKAAADAADKAEAKAAKAYAAAESKAERQAAASAAKIAKDEVKRQRLADQKEAKEREKSEKEKEAARGKLVEGVSDRCVPWRIVNLLGVQTPARVGTTKVYKPGEAAKEKVKDSDEDEKIVSSANKPAVEPQESDEESKAADVVKVAEKVKKVVPSGTVATAKKAPPDLEISSSSSSDDELVKVEASAPAKNKSKVSL